MDTAGELQFAAAWHLDITPRLRVFSEAEYATREKLEGRAGVTYLISKHFSLIAQWHSDFWWGGGLRWQF